MRFCVYVHDPFCINFCIRCDMWVEIYLFAIWIFIYSATICWKKNPFSIELPLHFCRKWIDHLCHLFLDFLFIKLIYMTSVFYGINIVKKERKIKATQNPKGEEKGREECLIRATIVSWNFFVKRWFNMYKCVCICVCAYWIIVHNTFVVSVTNVKI